MTSPWWVVLTALVAGAACGPEVGVAARVVATVAALGLLGRAPRRGLIALGLAVGIAGAWRQHAVVNAATHWGSGEHLAWVHIDRVTAGGAVGWLGAPGRPAVRARLRSASPLEAGTQGVARLSVHQVRRRRNPDEPNRRRAALAQRTLLEAKLLEWDPAASVAASPRTRVRGRANAWFASRLAGSSDLWRALGLGDRSGLTDEARDRFASLGLAHLLALSGLHVGLVLLALQRAGRRVGWGPAASFAPVVAWCLLAGLTPSLARALGMALWWWGAQRWRRPASFADSLAVLALLEWMIAPWRLCGVGWWLSYAATLSILRVAPVLNRLRRPVAAVVVSMAAQTATLPWTLATFGFVAPAASVFHLVAAPAFAALMTAGLALLPTALLVPLLRPACVALLQLITHGFGLVLDMMVRLEIPVWGHPGIGGLAWALALLAFGLGLVPAPSWRLRMALMGLLLVVVHLPLARRDPGWTSLDVGQGDAGVLRGSRRDWMVVDAGPRFPGWDAGARVVAPFLRRRNAHDVVLVLSHGHRDHTGGADALLASGRIGQLMMATVDSSRAWTRHLAAVAGRESVPVQWIAAGDSFPVGSLEVRCLWPGPGAAGFSTNSRSVVLAVEDRLLLTGDLEHEAESELVADLTDVQVLKLGHHGSRTSTSPPWLARLAPTLAVASCGRDNRYGHPHPVTLERLSQGGVTLLRTDRGGAIVVKWRRSGLQAIAVARLP